MTGAYMISNLVERMLLFPLLAVCPIHSDNLRHHFQLAILPQVIRLGPTSPSQRNPTRAALVIPRCPRILGRSCSPSISLAIVKSVYPPVRSCYELISPTFSISGIDGPLNRPILTHLTTRQSLWPTPDRIGTAT